MLQHKREKTAMPQVLKLHQCVPLSILLCLHAAVSMQLSLTCLQHAAVNMLLA
jgi:hypothetical protein